MLQFFLYLLLFHLVFSLTFIFYIVSFLNLHYPSIEQLAHLSLSLKLVVFVSQLKPLLIFLVLANDFQLLTNPVFDNHLETVPTDFEQLLDNPHNMAMQNVKSKVFLNPLLQQFLYNHRPPQ